MPRVARHGDVVGCGASLIAGSTKTHVNGMLVVRLGDSSSHGGVVISSSPDVYVEGSLVARLGDLHSCPIPGHGITPIVTASDNVFANG